MQNENNPDKNEKLLELVRNLVQFDGELRAKYNIGDKFRFIRDRLNALLVYTEEHVVEIKKKTERKKSLLDENETLVYVHLFNAQGIVLQSWHKMVVPSVFYDHSINRPIYHDKESIDAVIRSKPNKVQHAYLTIAVDKKNILPLNEQLKDSIGGQLIKVKDGSLKFERLISFSHNGNNYVVNENGELVKNAEHPH